MEILWVEDFEMEKKAFCLSVRNWKKRKRGERKEKYMH